jgi:hypothetical protein
MYSRPFPTSPKLADEATAMRESKNGEYLTAYPLYPWVRNSSMLSSRAHRGGRGDNWKLPVTRRHVVDSEVYHDEQAVFGRQREGMSECVGKWERS